MSKTMRTIVTAICTLFLLPLSAQEKTDPVYTLRFVSDKDMFYIPNTGDDTELEHQTAGKAGDADSYTLSLRANLLRWATLTPDLGIEWRISPSVGIMVNGSWTSWTWNDNARRSDTGRQGDLLGGGITGGYQLRLNKALALDFTLGLGYLNTDTERYDVIDGVRVRSGNETKHWIGPINAGVTLVWKLF